jgi:hypothetical protein
MLMPLIYLYLLVSVAGTILIIAFVRGATEERDRRCGKTAAADRNVFLRLTPAPKRTGRIAT